MFRKVLYTMQQQILAKHRRRKVEKVGGTEHYYLRGLSLSKWVWGHAPQEIFEKYCQEIELGGI